MIRKIEMYTIPNCHYCELAKKLINENGIIDVKIHTMGVDGMNPTITQSHIDRVNPSYGQVSTVPQIFINDEHIGGYDELAQFITEQKRT